MAGVTIIGKDHASHGMGLHTEQLKGRTQQRFFDLSEAHDRLSYPDSFDVDFNKRGEIVARIHGRSDEARLTRILDPLVKRAPGPKARRRAPPIRRQHVRRGHCRPARLALRAQ